MGCSEPGLRMTSQLNGLYLCKNVSKLLLDAVLKDGIHCPDPGKILATHHVKVFLVVACCLQGKGGQTSCFPNGTGRVTGEDSRLQ